MEESKQKMFNIVFLGISFMLIFTAFQTMGNVQTTILNSAKSNSSSGYVEGFTGDGYTSLAVIYAVFSMSNWFAPSVIALLGPRMSLIAGGIPYALFIIQLIYPNNYLLYGASALLGVGAAIIWTAQGNFLTINSDETTMTRNSGILWALIQCSLVIGNTYVFFEFRGVTDIDKEKRNVVTLVLSSVCAIGVLTFLILRPTPWANPSETSESFGPIKAFKNALTLGTNKYMILLSVTFFYTGLELTFWSGVYGTSVGATKIFEDSKSLVGLHGIVVGVGEILGGLLFGIFGHVLVKRGRDPVVLLGFLLHVVTFYLIFLNLPPSSPMGDTSETAFIVSNRHLAIFCSFMLGFGDACFNTQIFSMLGSVFSNDSASAFAIFKFVQSLSAAIAFFYSNLLSLYFQLLILVILCVAGTLTFCLVEWMTTRDRLLSEIERNEDGDNSCAVQED